MGWLLSTFGFCVLSALIPVFNAEVYLAALAASESPPLWPMAAVAAGGQMIGKVVWYYLGASALSWGSCVATIGPMRPPSLWPTRPRRVESISPRVRR